MAVTTIIAHEYSDTVEEGDVIRTEPEYTGDAEIGPDDVITIYVSDGPAPTAGGGGFPAVSMFGGLLQGMN